MKTVKGREKKLGQNPFVRVVCRWKTSAVIVHTHVIHRPSRSKRSSRYLTIECQTLALSNSARPSSAWAATEGTCRQSWRVNLIHLISTTLCWIKGGPEKNAGFREVIVYEMPKVGSTQKISKRSLFVRCIFFAKCTIYRKVCKSKAAILPATLLASLFHLPARIPKLYRHVEALVHLWSREERDPADSAS